MELKQANTVEAVREIVRISDLNKAPYTPIWARNIRRVSGEYTTDLEEELGVTIRRRRLKVTNARLMTILPVANPKLHYAIARELKAGFRFQAIAATNSRADVNRAAATTRMLKARLAEKAGQDYEECYMLMAGLKCCEPVFLLVEGDPTKRRPRMLHETSDAKGDVILKFLLPTQVAWYPGVRSFDETPVVTTEWMTPQEIDRRWPSGMNEKIFDDKDVYAGWDANSGMAKLDPALEEVQIKVQRLWIPPGESYPNGCQRIVLGEKYVKKTLKDRVASKDWETSKGVVASIVNYLKGKSNPETKDESIGTPDGQVPLIRFRGAPSNPSGLGRGKMDLIGGAARLLNRKFTAYQTISNYTPDVYVTAPAGVGEDEIHNNVIFIKQIPAIAGKGLDVSLRPTLMPLLAEIDWLDHKIDIMLGQPRSSRGEIPGTRTSSRTLETAHEYASEIDAPESELINTAFAKAQKRMVLEGREVWPKKFLYEAMGEHNRKLVQEFELADLKSVADIVVENDDPYPANKAARWKVANERFKNGGFGPPQDPKTFERYDRALNIPTAEDSFWDRQVQDQLVAQHMDGLRKKDVEVSVVCDDEYHAEEEMRRLAELAAAEDTTPEYESRVYVHCLLHVLNQRRKEKARGVGKMADLQGQQASIGLNTLAPEEQAAMAMAGGAPAPAPAQPAPEGIPPPDIPAAPGGPGMTPNVPV